MQPVKWGKEISRDELSVKTRNSLGSTLTIFLVPNDAAIDVERAVAGAPAPQKESEEELLDDIQERALEFIKDRVQRLDWDEMQDLVAGLPRAMNYKTRVSKAGIDSGKDIIASPDGFGFSFIYLTTYRQVCLTSALMEQI